MTNFYLYFRENMQSLGLPASETLFGNLQLALANAAAFIAHIDKFGQRITVKELLRQAVR